MVQSDRKNIRQYNTALVIFMPSN